MCFPSFTVSQFVCLSQKILNYFNRIIRFIKNASLHTKSPSGSCICKNDIQQNNKERERNRERQKEREREGEPKKRKENQIKETFGVFEVIGRRTVSVHPCELFVRPFCINASV